VSSRNDCWSESKLTESEAERLMERRPRVLLGLSGSVAALKAPQLAAALSSFADVRCVATAAALHFLDCAESLEAQQQLSSALATPSAPSGSSRNLLGHPVLTDQLEWASWRSRADGVLHVSLRRWADVLVIAPLSANTLAKLAGGLCDNLLTCIARAWDVSRPLLVAPAMNTAMWEHPLTEQVWAIRLCSLLSLQR